MWQSKVELPTLASPILGLYSSEIHRNLCHSVGVFTANFSAEDYRGRAFLTDRNLLTSQFQKASEYIFKYKCFPPSEHDLNKSNHTFHFCQLPLYGRKCIIHRKHHLNASFILLYIYPQQLFNNAQHLLQYYCPIQ